MTSRITPFFVFTYFDGQPDAVPAGKLKLLEDGSTLLASDFRYGRKYVERRQAIELDPFTLSFAHAGVDADRQPVIIGNQTLAEFGVFRDAAPDNWGRRVIENKLRRVGPLPESEYIRHAGSNRMGALDFRAAATSPESDGQLASLLDLAYLQEAAERVDRGEPVPSRLELIFDAGVSMGGARPKAVIQTDNRQWLAKFGMPTDRYDFPAIEHATLRLAKAAGLDVPDTRLEPLGSGRFVMLIERFDRQPVPAGYARRHFVSALTMLCAHESDSPNRSYAEIAQAIAAYGVAGTIRKDQAELFGRMVFNILVSNNDDHLRNHGFVYDAASGRWRLSPLYDVMPMPGHSQDRSLHLGVGDEGRSATLVNALSRHAAFGLTRIDALAIIDRVSAVVREWQVYFEAAGVAGTDISAIASAFRHPRDIGHDQLG